MFQFYSNLQNPQPLCYLTGDLTNIATSKFHMFPNALPHVTCMGGGKRGGSIFINARLRVDQALPNSTSLYTRDARFNPQPAVASTAATGGSPTWGFRMSSKSWAARSVCPGSAL